MTDLEQATTAFFRAVLDTGKDILGHTEFGFKIDATVGCKQEDQEGGKKIGAKIQEALIVAQRIVQPDKLEGGTGHAGSNEEPRLPGNPGISQ